MMETLKPKILNVSIMFAQQLAEKLQVITTYCSANDPNND